MMRAGEYWIGDLCYVMHDSWDEVCELIFDGNQPIDGEFNLADGRRFAIFSTKFGDGEYECSTGDSLAVDSGSIGCIRLIDIRDPDADLDLGIITEFDSAFEVSGGDGFISIGGIEIDTGVEYSDDFYFDGEDE